VRCQMPTLLDSQDDVKLVWVWSGRPTGLHEHGGPSPSAGFRVCSVQFIDRPAKKRGERKPYLHEPCTNRKGPPSHALNRHDRRQPRSQRTDDFLLLILRPPRRKMRQADDVVQQLVDDDLTLA
jgi:hypothetical protein